MNFSLKVFRGQFDPKRGYKTANKSSKKSVDPEDFRQRKLSRVTFRTKLKTAAAIPLHITDNKSGISNNKLRPLIAYQPMSHHRTAKNKATPKNDLHPLTSWHLFDGRREPVYYSHN